MQVSLVREPCRPTIQAYPRAFTLLLPLVSPHRARLEPEPSDSLPTLNVK
jgi:hypothetical protein